MAVGVSAGMRKGRASGESRGRGTATTVIAGFLVLAASNAVGFYGLAVYLGSLEASGAFSLELVSTLTSVYFLVSGFASLLAGRGVAVLGVRTIVLLGALTSGCGVWLVGHAQESWQLLAAYVLLGVGMSLTGPIPLTTALIRVVDEPERRNQAMAVMLSGMTAGGAIFVPVLAGAVERYGLASATAVAAPLALLAIGVPVLLLGRTGAPGARVRRRKRAGSAPSVADSEVAAISDQARVQEAGVVGWGSRHASRTFVLVCIVFAVFLGAQVGFNTQLYTIASESGIPGAGGALGVVAGVGMVARVIGIVLVRWVPTELFLAGMAGLQCLSPLVLLFFTDQLGLYVCAALLGMAVGNASVLAPVITIKLFGELPYPGLLARLSFVMTLGIASGPALAGYLRSVTGSYDAVLAGVFALSLAVVLLCVQLGRQQRDVSIT